MELVERYIYAVTRHMADNREDVADELRGIIEDALDEKGSRSKKNIEAVLTALGDPEILAYKYKGTKQYLIGPKLYVFYLRILKLTAAIGLPIAFLVGVIDQIGKQPESIIGLIIAAIGVAIGAAIQIFFWVTLVFVILERSDLDTKDLRKYNSWTPDTLPQITAKRQIPISEAIGDAIWYAVIIALPFIAQPLIGTHSNGQVTPFFNAQIWEMWTPIIVAIGVVGLIKSFLKARIGNWTTKLVAFNILFAAIVSAMLITAPLVISLVNPAFMKLLYSTFTTVDEAQINLTMNWTIGIAIALTIGGYLYDVFNSIRLARKLKK